MLNFRSTWNVRAVLLHVPYYGTKIQQYAKSVKILSSADTVSYICPSWIRVILAERTFEQPLLNTSRPLFDTAASSASLSRAMLKTNRRHHTLYQPPEQVAQVNAKEPTVVKILQPTKWSATNYG